MFYSVISQNGNAHYSAAVFLLTITKSGHLAEIKWSVCITNFHRILCNKFSMTHYGLVVHIGFVRMVKFKPIIQLPVDHLAHAVLSSHISYLCKLTVLAYYVIDRFVSITTSSTDFPSHVQFLSYTISLVCSLKYPYSCFLLIFFIFFFRWIFYCLHYF